MRVRVLYFGVLKELLGAEQEEANLTDGCAVADLIKSIEARGRIRQDLWSSIAVAVNQEYVSVSVLLREGDEVALLPPVSGGAREYKMHAC